LLSHINNLNSPSTQPTTPTSTPIIASTPPIMNVVGLTQTPPLLLDLVD